jgi:molybdopterin/thiamine biosynthesis adenylyltransferase
VELVVNCVRAFLCKIYYRSSDQLAYTLIYHVEICAVKNVVLTGFGDITLLDLDTIDLSNLNRQFLFRKKDVKQSKAMVRAFGTAYVLHPCSHSLILQVAAKTAHHFNPSVKIHPIHANIKDPEFDVSWFRGFDIVMNALDNIGTVSSIHRSLRETELTCFPHYT